MDDGVSFLGLGFSSTPATTNQDATAADAADSLMKHYLQQCLDYHDQQPQQEEAVEAAPQFVSAAPLPPTILLPTEAAQPLPTMKSTADAAHEAMAKARAIVQKFQLQQQQPLLPSDDSSTTPPLVFRQRRERFYEVHRERLHKATMKNFEYVARREEQRLQLQLQQIQQTRHVETKLQQSHATILQKRRQEQQKQFQSTAGIGTSQRTSLEKKKQKKGHATLEDSVAIYVSGLPVDGSIMEDSLKKLFASYGTIRRVHLYRNKATGQIKGDALVVFVLGSSKRRQDFLDAVCSQMTGAQLPCGSILQVEPADPEYKAKLAKNNRVVEETASYYGPSSQEKPATTAAAETQVVVAASSGDEEKRAQEATEDLDDFFASLT